MRVGLVVRMIEPEAYWTYKTPPTQAEGPPGFKGNWFSLSPCMRREIWRDHERRVKPSEAVSAPVAIEASSAADVPVDMNAARKKRERKRYADLVMKTYCDMDHADKRAFLDRKADVQIAARERL